MSSTRESRPIDWSKYPIRTCQSLHCCDVCGESITLGQQYRDGGYGRRAHVACLSLDDGSRCIEITLPVMPGHLPASTTRGWMGGGTVGGGDPDDADRAPECEACRGAEQPCAKCIPPTPYPEAFVKPIPMLPMTEAARLKAKEAIRKLRERDNDIMLDANYVRGREHERERIIAYYTELFQRAPFSVSDMLSDIRRNQHHKPGEP